jgi:hypothetical protein
MVIGIEKGNAIGIEKGNTRKPIEIVSFSLLGVFLFLGLHGFAEAVTLTVHLEDVASVYTFTFCQTYMSGFRQVFENSQVGKFS